MRHVRTGRWDRKGGKLCNNTRGRQKKGLLWGIGEERERNGIIGEKSY